MAASTAAASVDNTASATADDGGADDDTASVAITTKADLADIKTAATTVIAGTSLTYTITITNNGPSDAQTVKVYDALPGELLNDALFCVFTAPVTDCTVADPWVSPYTHPTALAAGAEFTIKITATVDPSTIDGSTISNSATVDSATDDPNPANNTDFTTTTATGLADVSITKSAPATIPADDQLTYTITVKNESTTSTGSTAIGISFTDTLQGDTTLVSDASLDGVICTGTTTLTCTVPDLAPQASATVTITVDIPTTAGSTIHNEATVSTSTTSDPNTANDTGDSDTTVVPGAASAATSTITASPISTTVDGSSLITVQLKDQYGNDLVVGGDNVSLATDLGSLTGIVDNNDGTYQATLTSTTPGLATISGTVNTVAIVDDATVTFTVGAASAATSTITASPISTTVDGSSLITVQLKDQYGNDLVVGGDNVSLATDLGSLTGIVDNNDGTYQATLTSTTPGLATISGTVNTVAIVDDATVTFTVGAASAATSTITASPISTTVDGSSLITVQLNDQYGNDPGRRRRQRQPGDRPRLADRHRRQQRRHLPGDPDQHDTRPGDHQRHRQHGRHRR